MELEVLWTGNSVHNSMTRKGESFGFVFLWGRSSQL